MNGGSAEVPPVRVWLALSGLVMCIAVIVFLLGRASVRFPPDGNVQALPNSVIQEYSFNSDDGMLTFSNSSKDTRTLVDSKGRTLVTIHGNGAVDGTPENLRRAIKLLLRSVGSGRPAPFCQMGDGGEK